ncbi:hypothetical protein BDZ85DRAFT_174934, partial [Elsinoe ampelina]
LLSPLTPAFTLTVMIWLELAQSLPFHKGQWEEKLGLRYKLARICCVRLGAAESASTAETPRPYLASVNPQHVVPAYLHRDLKWLGRLLILTILLGQYAQAAVLLVRRIVSKRYATVDIAMFLMVVSGIIGLLQSLLITFIHTDWTIKEEIDCCGVNACALPECINLRQQSDLTETRNLKLLGFINLKGGVTRMIMHMMVAGFVQLQVVVNFARMPAKDII